MPIVENVLSHWIDLQSTSLDEVDYDDHLFFFVLKSTQDILVTTSLSALTLGVDQICRQLRERLAMQIHHVAPIR